LHSGLGQPVCLCHQAV